MDLTTTPTPSITPTITPTNMPSPSVTPTTTLTPTPSPTKPLEPPILNTSYVSAPQAWAPNECLDVIVQIGNFGMGPSVGQIVLLMPAVNSWTFNFNPSQTTAIDGDGNTVSVQNSSWIFEPLNVGPILVGYNFKTNVVLNRYQILRYAVQICAPSAETTRNLNTNRSAGNGGDPEGQILRIVITSG